MKSTNRLKMLPAMVTAMMSNSNQPVFYPNQPVVGPSNNPFAINARTTVAMNTSGTNHKRRARQLKRPKQCRHGHTNPKARMNGRRKRAA